MGPIDFHNLEGREVQNAEELLQNKMKERLNMDFKYHYERVNEAIEEFHAREFFAPETDFTKRIFEMVSSMKHTYSFPQSIAIMYANSL